MKKYLVDCEMTDDKCRDRRNILLELDIVVERFVKSSVK